MKRIILSALIIGLCIAALPVQAQQEGETPKLTLKEEQSIFTMSEVWGVGAYGGILSGIGLSGRYHAYKRLGFQVTAGAIKLDELLYDFGFEVQYDFDAGMRSRLYGMIGGGYYYSGKTDSAGVKENRLTGPLRLGLGIGYEFAISERVVLNVLVPAIIYFTNGDILPLVPQVGLYYYFR